MNENSLHEFYIYAVLPQFGIGGSDISWQATETLEGDESLHRFRMNGQEYALVYEDHDGLGRNESFIKENVLQPGQTYEFIEPVSQTNVSPSYDGFRLPAPSRYSRNITGTYTLLCISDSLV